MATVAIRDAWTRNQRIEIQSSDASQGCQGGAVPCRSPAGIGSPAVSLTRRQFLWSAAAAAALSSPRLGEPWQVALKAQAAPESAAGRFRHGVASGDPLADRVVLWTRVTPVDTAATPVEIRWRVA